MERRKTFALLISGNEQRHVDGIIRFRNYLTDEARFNPRRIWAWVDGNHYYVLDKVKCFFQKAKVKAPDEPVVITYHGHGVEGGITPSKWGRSSFVSYQDLAQLCNHDGGVLFVNDCCHSGSAIPAFRERGILQTGLVLAASREKELSYGSRYLRFLIDCYTSKMPLPDDLCLPLRNVHIRRKLERVEEKIKLLEQESSRHRKEKYNDLLCLHSVYKHITEELKKYPDQHPQRCGLDLDHLLFPQ